MENFSLLHGGVWENSHGLDPRESSECADTNAGSYGWYSAPCEAGGEPLAHRPCRPSELRGGKCTHGRGVVRCTVESSKVQWRYAHQSLHKNANERVWVVAGQHWAVRLRDQGPSRPPPETVVSPPGRYEISTECADL